MIHNEQRDELLRLASKFESAMLVTHGLDGQLQARPMMIAKLEPSGDLWFVSDRNSGKIDEIMHRPEVCVTMAGGGDFVSVSGTAQVTPHNQSQIDELWHESWRVWFPEGRNDPRIALLHIHAHSAEYWSHSGTSGIKYLFEAAKAYLQGDRPHGMDTQQHSHINL